MSTARDWYDQHGLAFPPMPADLEDGLKAVSDTAWATPSAPRSFWDTKALAHAAAEGFPGRQASLGSAGRGMASNALYVNVVTDKIALFVEHAIGNVGDDPEEQAATIAADYAVMARIFERAEARRGTPIVVLYSTLRLDAAIFDGGEWTNHRTYDLLHAVLDLLG